MAGTWSRVGVSGIVIDASFQALVDAIRANLLANVMCRNR
jgi:hypothetical protein